MTFRKEKKYRLTFSEQKILKKTLVLKGMKLLHPPRKINSCYFDNVNFAMFNNSEEGVLPRKKIRVRWYDEENKSSKETKISSIEGRFKIVEKFYELASLKKCYALQLIDNFYGILKPSLIVSYYREYYSLDHLRITFDDNIEYIDLRSMNHQKYRDDECVMEVKTSIEISDDSIEKIIKYPTARFSKYSRGLLISDR